MGEKSLTITMPLPPSVNNLFATFTDKKGHQRRIKSRNYQAWAEMTGYASGWQRISEDKQNRIRWRCAIVAYGLSENRDVDNLIKPTVDLICTMTGLRDRSGNLRGVSADVSDDEVNGQPWIVVTITLTAAPR